MYLHFYYFVYSWAQIEQLVQRVTDFVQFVIEVADPQVFKRLHEAFEFLEHNQSAVGKLEDEYHLDGDQLTHKQKQEHEGDQHNNQEAFHGLVGGLVKLVHILAVELQGQIIICSFRQG